MKEDIKLTFTCFEEDGKMKIASKPYEGCNSNHLWCVLSGILNMTGAMYKENNDMIGFIERIDYFKKCAIDYNFNNNSLEVKAFGSDMTEEILERERISFEGREK